MGAVTPPGRLTLGQKLTSTPWEGLRTKSQAPQIRREFCTSRSRRFLPPRQSAGSPGGQRGFLGSAGDCPARCPGSGLLFGACGRGSLGGEAEFSSMVSSWASDSAHHLGQISPSLGLLSIWGEPGSQTVSVTVCEALPRLRPQARAAPTLLLGQCTENPSRCVASS